MRLASLYTFYMKPPLAHRLLPPWRNHRAYALASICSGALFPPFLPSHTTKSQRHYHVSPQYDTRTAPLPITAFASREKNSVSASPLRWPPCACRSRRLSGESRATKQRGDDDPSPRQRNPAKTAMPAPPSAHRPAAQAAPARAPHPARATHPSRTTLRHAAPRHTCAIYEPTARRKPARRLIFSPA